MKKRPKIHSKAQLRQFQELQDRGMLRQHLPQRPAPHVEARGLALQLRDRVRHGLQAVRQLPQVLLDAMQLLRSKTMKGL